MERPLTGTEIVAAMPVRPPVDLPVAGGSVVKQAGCPPSNADQLEAIELSNLMPRVVRSEMINVPQPDPRQRMRLVRDVTFFSLTSSEPGELPRNHWMALTDSPHYGSELKRVRIDQASRSILARYPHVLHYTASEMVHPTPQDDGDNTELTRGIAASRSERTLLFVSKAVFYVPPSEAATLRSLPDALARARLMAIPPAHAPVVAAVVGSVVVPTPDGMLTPAQAEERGYKAMLETVDGDTRLAGFIRALHNRSREAGDPAVDYPLFEVVSPGDEQAVASLVARATAAAEAADAAEAAAAAANATRPDWDPDTNPVLPPVPPPPAPSEDETVGLAEAPSEPSGL